MTVNTYPLWNLQIKLCMTQLDFAAEINECKTGILRIWDVPRKVEPYGILDHITLRPAESFHKLLTRYKEN